MDRTAQQLSPEQIAQIERAVAEVATSVGFGTVAIVIEKGSPRRIQQMVDAWLLPRAQDVSTQEHLR